MNLIQTWNYFCQVKDMIPNSLQYFIPSIQVIISDYACEDDLYVHFYKIFRGNHIDTSPTRRFPLKAKCLAAAYYDNKYLECELILGDICGLYITSGSTICWLWRFLPISRCVLIDAIVTKNPHLIPLTYSTEKVYCFLKILLQRAYIFVAHLFCIKWALPQRLKMIK